MDMRAILLATACVGWAVTPAVLLSGQASAHRAVIPVESSSHNAPADALGPLRDQTLYVGALQGSDTEDWFQYWHVPRWDGQMALRSTCATRVELYSTAGDTLEHDELLAHFELGPAGAEHRYRTPEPVVRRMLVRLVRADGDRGWCDWHVDARSGFAPGPRTPTVTASVERKAGRAVALRIRARMQAPGAGQRPAFIQISGSMRRALPALVPASGVISRRIPLAAGVRGTVRVEVSAAATARLPPIPATGASVKVTTPPPAVRAPVVRPPAPAPPRRPVVKKPRTPAAAVHRFLANPPSGMRFILREAKFAQGYTLGPTRRFGKGSATVCARAKVRSDPAFPNNPTGEYLTFRFYLVGRTAPRVMFVEGPNFGWTRPGSSLPWPRPIPRCPAPPS